MPKNICAGSFLLPIIFLLASCSGGPSKSDVEAMFKVKIEFMECAKAVGAPGYECTGRTTGGSAFSRRFINADGRWRAM